ncbi:glutamate synthase small subunit [Paenibacillus timonensis]|uniref:glutamate synthase subunit beta n=1 Tax=Paenibacillus sp. J53TS2 TaxID=2807197 RepID=UPI0012D88AD1|nr:MULTISPECIES: glutamate synthase subunit beta [Paenibacillus]MUG87076.1 glutamate synthase small subunit [Paenibacillus timonensis]GIP49191.1 glutamate synthase subunit beta [Paenibacillus sp. J53TS2]
MGKATGFLEYRREVPGEIRPQERIGSWQEFVVPLEEEKLRMQGARCMDCGTPFCHAGQLLSGMASGCPAHNLIPEWNDLVYRGSWKEALKRLQKTSNFPEFTSRVCPAPCEGACTVGKSGQPVTIKSIERAIIDHGFEEGWIRPRVPAASTGKKVAVVGSGPAGLACADQLNKAGHAVTVYERADRIGGLLMYGIPNMKLDKQIVQRRVNLLAAEGIRFVTGVEIGEELPADRLRTEFDAVVLCCGATQAREMKIEGRELNGVHQAMEFLSRNTQSLLDSGLQDGNFLSAKDKHVVVIGGGDTGTDCVATAIRQGCKSVTQLEIMPKLPLSRGQDNPWPEWPKVQKTDYGQAEAAEMFGQDPRRYETSTKSLQGNEQGQITGVHTVRVEWNQVDGRWIPVETPGSEQVLPADLVLLALGFAGPEAVLPEQLGLDQDERTNVKAELGDFRTNVKGVFAAGDMRRGQSLVVWAMYEGRLAAREVDRYLMGSTMLP